VADLKPPDNALVPSLDKKTKIQSLDRKQPKLQLRPGHLERHRYDYEHHGTSSIYAAFNILTGEANGCITQRHGAKELLDSLRKIDQETPKNADLLAILDNSSTHKGTQRPKLG
jgi:hypothetical protein